MIHEVHTDMSTLAAACDVQMLNFMLEKTHKSLAPKFDYWRAIIPNHPDHREIDTHKITSEEAGTGMQMINPSQMDPAQLRAMGLKGF